MPEQTAMYHFTVSPPRGPGQDDVSTLLRQVADTLDALGAVTVHDITFHVDMTEDGSWPLMSVYYEVEISAEAAARTNDDGWAADRADADAGIAVVQTPDDDIEVIESSDAIVADDRDYRDDPAAFDRGEPFGEVAGLTSSVETESVLAEWAPPPSPVPTERPAAYVDMISTFTREPAGLHAVPAADDASDRATQTDVENTVGNGNLIGPLADVVEIGAAIAPDPADDAAAVVVDAADDTIVDDTIVEPSPADTTDAEEISAAPFAPSFRTFEQTAPEPAVHIDDRLPPRSGPPPTPTYPAWRTQLPVDRTSLRRLKDLWRTNTRRRND
jgi:hypothetical protein